MCSIYENIAFASGRASLLVSQTCNACNIAFMFQYACCEKRLTLREQNLLSHYPNSVFHISPFPRHHFDLCPGRMKTPVKNPKLRKRREPLGIYTRVKSKINNYMHRAKMRVHSYTQLKSENVKRKKVIITSRCHTSST